MPAIIIDIGYQLLRPDQTGQEVDVTVSSSEQSDPLIGGFHLKAQVGSRGFGPVFEDLQFGSIWNTFPHQESGGPLPDNAHLAEGSVAFLDGRAAKANGALVEFTLDTSGVYAGTYNLSLTATSLGNSESFDGLGSAADTVIINGVVQVQSLWQNARNASDVSGDGYVSAMDLLLIVNRINTAGSGPLTPPASGDKVGYTYDVNGDGNLSAVDAVVLLNCLNNNACVREPPVISTASQPPGNDQPNDPNRPQISAPHEPGNQLGGEENPPANDPQPLEAPIEDPLASDPATNGNEAEQIDIFFALLHLNDALARNELG